MRVSQLDSHLLDQELFLLLNQNVDSALSLFKRSDLVTTVSKTALRAILWKIGIWDHGLTYGAQLQSLRYFGLTRNKKIFLGLVSVFGPLLQEKVGAQLRGQWRQVVAYLEGLYEVLALVNFISYIAGSRYDSVLHRILRIQLRPVSSAYRAVSFEFLNRQLIWTQFTEFLLVFLPLLNLPRLRRKLGNYLPQSESQKLDFLPKRVCAICYGEGVEGADCVNPYQADCGDIYCYGCIASQLSLAEGEGWTCVRCGQTIQNARPWSERSDVNLGQHLPTDLQVDGGSLHEDSDSDSASLGSVSTSEESEDQDCQEEDSSEDSDEADESQSENDIERS